MTTELIRFTQWARESPQRQYNALMGMLTDPEGLNASFERQARSKAPGVDGMRKADYAEGLQDRLADLVGTRLVAWGIDRSRCGGSIYRRRAAAAAR